MNRMLLYRWVVFFLILVTMTTQGWAETETVPPNEPLPEAPVSATESPGWRKRMSDPERWNDWHERMSTNIVAAAERIDHFFGDERLDEENRGTRLSLGLGPRYHEQDGASLVTDFKARIALPHLEKRFQLIFDDSFESEETGKASAFSEAVKDSEPDTALRYIITQDAHRRLSSDAGVRLSSPSQIFGRLRGRIIVPYELWELRLSQTVAWFTDDGFVETSEMRWSRAIGIDLLLRFNSRLTWEETENGVRPAQSITLFKELTQRRGYFFEISGAWPEFPHTREAIYQAEFTYRQLLHSHWLFFEISPGVEFPQEREYSTTPYIQFTISAVFDEYN